MVTPWGKADYEEKASEGITFYGTPSHGGYKVKAKLNNKIPEYMRNEGGWYEEDCDWCLPVVSLGLQYFPQMSTETFTQALETFKNWHPGKYEKFFKTTLKEGESYLRDEELFRHRTRDLMVGVAGLGMDNGMVKVTACRGGRDKRGQYQGTLFTYFVPAEEYRARNHFGFIVDTEKYQAI